MRKLLQYFIPIIIVAVILFFLLRGCNSTIKETVRTIHDTSYVVHDSVIYRDIGRILTKTIKIPIEQIPPALIPSEHPDILAKQYGQLLTAHTNKHIYLDTLKIDSMGWIVIIDTVQYNILQSRKFNYHIKERQINTITTITRETPKKNMVFIGLEAGFTQSQFQSANIGLLLVNRKDNIIGIGVGYNLPLKTTIYSAKYYTKLHF